MSSYKGPMDEMVSNVCKAISDELREEITAGFDIGPPNHFHFNCRYKPVYTPAGGYSTPTAEQKNEWMNSVNLFRSGKVYHKDGTTTEWRNYAVIKTAEREFKAPVLREAK